MSRRVGSGGVNWALLNIYCSVCFVAYRRTLLLDYKRKAQNIGMESVSLSVCLSVCPERHIDLSEGSINAISVRFGPGVHRLMHLFWTKL